MEIQPERKSVIYHLIVVPVDGSVLAERAIAYARQLAQVTGAGLLLLRSSLVRLRPPQGTTEATICAQEERYLQGWAEHLRDEPFATTTLLAFADPADAIINAAAEYQADLILMTTHGRGWTGRLAFGSVATVVLERAQCPVLLLPARYDLPSDREATVPPKAD